MSERDVFTSGRYHQLRARELYNDPERASYNLQSLHTGYIFSQHLINELIDGEAENPLVGENVNVLLMGFEGYQTADVFTRFIHARNPQAVITIADFSEYPLTQCLENGLPALANVNLVQADTTKLTFSDNSFNLIETDGLLQFLSPNQKREALRQWYKVLKPGGVVTTRDRFASIAQPKEWDDLNKWRGQLHRRLGAYSYPTSLEVMSYLFTAQGFSTIFAKQYPRAYYPIKRLIHGIVARKPKS